MGRPRVVEVVGDVVRRPAAAWTETVHTLLQHLFDAGLPVPEPLGIDSGIETVRFLAGDAGEQAWPHQICADSVRSAGSLLRAVHDATTSWVPPEHAVWAFPPEPGAGSVICHGDVKPPNIVWKGGRAAGLIDWDSARPAPRLSDVAYAITWIGPFFEAYTELQHRGLPPDTNPHARAEAFLAGYGWTEPTDLRQAMTARRRQAIQEVGHLARQGIEPAATWVAQGWTQRWLNELEAHPDRAAPPSGVPNQR